jgi:hypothetical protein
MGGFVTAKAAESLIAHSADKRNIAQSDRPITRIYPRAARSADPGTIAPRAVSPCAQAKSAEASRDKTTRRANQQNMSSPLAKNIPLNLTGKSALRLRPSHPMTRGGSRSSRTCGGMRWTRGCD